MNAIVNQAIRNKQGKKQETKPAPKKADKKEGESNDIVTNAIARKKALVAPAQESALMSSIDSVLNPVVQMAYGANKSIAETIDFFGVDIINAGLAKAGVDLRIPEARAMLDKYAGESEMEAGLLKDVATATGETATLAGGLAGLFKGAVKYLPQKTALESPSIGVTRDLAAPTMGTELTLGGAAGAGAEVGEEYLGEPGAVLGGVVGPLGVIPLAKGVTTLAPPLKDAAVNVKNTVTGKAPTPKEELPLSTQEANRIIQDQAKRSGLTIEEIITKYEKLGPDGRPADIDPVFAQALRTISNENPLLQGSANRELAKRQQGEIIDDQVVGGQGQRVEEAFDTSLKTQGRELDAELEKWDAELTPKIQEKYKEAGEKPLRLSPRLKAMIEEPKGYFKDAQRKANKVLETKRAAGEQVTHFDLIDEHKKALDDMISSAMKKGDRELARSLLIAKHALIDEVDAAIPEYKDARMLYAGKASLENSALLGEDFLKTSNANIAKDLKRMSPLEKDFYKLGAKKALQEKIENEGANRKLMAKYFGKNGSINKLSILFDDKKAFQSFKDQMEREADFALTDNIVRGNSTTIRQLKQDEALSKKLLDTATDLSSSNNEKGRQLLGIAKELNKPDSEAVFMEGKRKAGEFLLNEGIDAKKLEAILQDGREKELLRILNDVANKYTKDAAGVTKAVSVEAVTGPANQERAYSNVK